MDWCYMLLLLLLAWSYFSLSHSFTIWRRTWDLDLDSDGEVKGEEGAELTGWLDVNWILILCFSLASSTSHHIIPFTSLQ